MTKNEMLELFVKVCDRADQILFHNPIRPMRAFEQAIRELLAEQKEEGK
jgi:hypothetical protein